MNKGFIAFLVAALLAFIGFVIYWLMFRQKTVSPSFGIPSVSPQIPNNPIDSKGDAARPEYVPVTPPSSDSQSITINQETVIKNDSAGFNASPQESLTPGKNALSERTNNPGALFWDGSTNWQGMNKSKTKKNQIIYFDSVDYGVRAQLMTLKNYARKHGINTLLGITTRYAPYGHGNNNPAAYARTLATCLAMDIDTKFDMDANRNLLAAIGYYIHRVEAGYFFVPRSEYLEWSTKV